MQTIRITTSGIFKTEFGISSFTKNYSATSDNPPAGRSSYVSGSSSDGYILYQVQSGKVVYEGFGAYGDSIGVFPKVKSYFQSTRDDNIYFDGKLIQESALTIAQREEAERQRILAEQEAARQRVLAEQAQLEAKAAMLNSPTATFSSPDVKAAEIAETAREIEVFNEKVSSLPPASPSAPPAGASGAPSSPPLPPAQKAGILIVALIVVIALLYMLKGK